MRAIFALVEQCAHRACIFCLLVVVRLTSPFHSSSARSMKSHVFLFIICRTQFASVPLFFAMECLHILSSIHARVCVYARVYIISYSFILYYYYVSQQRAIKWRAFTNKWSSKSVENMLVIDIAFVQTKRKKGKEEEKEFNIFQLKFL